jgi:hypothetical protein
MCYTCGCNLPYDDMGDENNITEKDFQAASTTQAGKNEGIAEAKRHMYELLRSITLQADLRCRRSIEA